MRYWILVVLLNGLFALVMHFAAPDMVGSNGYYAAQVVCTLIALVITWRDEPGILDNILIFLVQWGVMIAAIAFSVWGVGCKLGLWENDGPDVLFSSAFHTLLPDLAILTGMGILGIVYIRYLHQERFG
ncbi:hypothetical protein [Klebsiella sp. BIGb0407]|uniref:hypothetical protein n=1 Tax=Klebsiella sp. BIGb0407 TaxID=2940603 RepID=UPI002168B0FA|nr:hypothetical protein [Klebsiella sp. BIGb0407]MCS3434329.1 hypothetical protein [Klebsiella sp. BIGb0407]